MQEYNKPKKIISLLSLSLIGTSLLALSTLSDRKVDETWYSKYESTGESSEFMGLYNDLNKSDKLKADSETSSKKLKLLIGNDSPFVVTEEERNLMKQDAINHTCLYQITDLMKTNGITKEDCRKNNFRVSEREIIVKDGRIMYKRDETPVMRHDISENEAVMNLLSNMSK